MKHRPANGHRFIPTVFLSFAFLALVLADTARGAAPVSITGTAVQGPMNAATITAYAVNPTSGINGAVLATTTSNSGGRFALQLAGPSAGPVRVTASGGTFVSEANGSTIKTPSPVSVLLPSVPANVAVSINPLTGFVNSLAVGLLTHGGAADLPTAVSDATASIEADYGLSSDPATLIPDFTTAAIGTDAGNFGLILGALAVESRIACPVGNGALVSALASDIADGVFDGMVYGTPINLCGHPLWSIAGTVQFQDALSGQAQLQLAMTGFGFGGGGNALTHNGVTPALLPAPIAVINSAVALTAPASINSFAPSADTAVMNSTRAHATATLLPSGKVLIAGGLVYSPVRSTTAAELYDPATNSFTSTPAMNVPRDRDAAVLLGNGQVLIAGGVNNENGVASTNTNTVELYNPATNTFAAATSIPVMNFSRDRPTATLLTNGKVLIAGGFGVTDSLASTDLYDPVTNTFATSPPTMNSTRRDATATLLPNGLVLIAGGHGGSKGIPLKSTELYNPVTNTFATATATATMNVPRAYATATLLSNGKVLIAGGFGTGGYLASCELYDPVANSFAPASSTPLMNTARDAATAALMADGQVLIAGGYNGSYLTSTELYDPVSNSFAAARDTVPMNVGRDYATATLLPDGHVLIAGGQAGGGVLNTTELYTP